MNQRVVNSRAILQRTGGLFKTVDNPNQKSNKSRVINIDLNEILNTKSAPNQIEEDDVYTNSTN